MSLFKWSTPERRKGNQALPIIPNEIYIYIFESIAPPTGNLIPEELTTFTHLSLVCRFFANFCLPRIYESVTLSGAMFHNVTPVWIRNDATYKSSREATLCTQIAAKEPLALSLAKSVKTCLFADWKFEEPGSWAVELFMKKYLVGMSYMTNIRMLKISASFVCSQHWRVIGALRSLEELSFQLCRFTDGPADVQPEKRVKIKVFRLEVTGCIGEWQPVAAIDPQPLCSLTTDVAFFNRINWPPRSALTELQLRPSSSRCFWSLDQVHLILAQASQSVETLSLSINNTFHEPPKVLTAPDIFDNPSWKNLPFLRSLKLPVWSHTFDAPKSVLSSALREVACLHTSVRSLTLDNLKPWEMSSKEVQCILHDLHDKVDPTSGLLYVTIQGKIFRMVDGKWALSVL